MVADTAVRAGWKVAGYLADPPEKTVDGMLILGGTVDIARYAESPMIVAIGDQDARRRFSLEIIRCGTPATIIDPSCTISQRAKIGRGVIVVAGAIVNVGAQIGDYCILNTACSVDHDCVLADGVQLCPGARLTGKIRCGEGAFIGTGAIVLPGVEIGANVIVGAGSVVTKDALSGVFVGNPAKRVK